MRIALAQINTVVGDIDGNLDRILFHLPDAAAAGADLIVFPEMCISGYPPLDLVERPRFLQQTADAFETLVTRSRDYPELGILVGFPKASNQSEGKQVLNVAALVANGSVVHEQAKTLLPTYDVFDEARHFRSADTVLPVEFKGETLGISICEDAWNAPELFGRRPYSVDPIAILAEKGATLMINISASPYTMEKEELRVNLVCGHARRYKTPFVFVNQVGGNDELIFDGRSLYVDADGNVRLALPMFGESVTMIDTAIPPDVVQYEVVTEEKGILDALTLGTRDYMSKCGFEKAIVGLSGGIDSAVTLAIAVRAVGATNVLALAMPSPYSSESSVEDAKSLCEKLGVELHFLNISDIMDSYQTALAPEFADTEPGVTEENIQARIRGNLLMAYSNKFGYRLLSTGNKSELAVGYCTLYGDMSGGLAVISDVPKTMVYRLARHINSNGVVIPENIIEKEPSAELRPDQKDLDTLPPYETLDAILDLYVEDGMSPEEIIARGYDHKTVLWVVDAVKNNEYKRKQAASGLKVTSKAFGMGRRFPIAARYKA